MAALAILTAVGAPHKYMVATLIALLIGFLIHYFVRGRSLRLIITSFCLLWALQVALLPITPFPQLAALTRSTGKTPPVTVVKPTPSSAVTTASTITTSPPTTITPSSETPTALRKLGTRTTTKIRYANCTAVRAAGKAPLVKGDAGYRRQLDPDGDGVACPLRKAARTP